jgi:hypothetical protein
MEINVGEIKLLLCIWNLKSRDTKAWTLQEINQLMSGNDTGSQQHQLNRE